MSELQDFFQETCKALGSEERLNNLYRIRPKRMVPGERSRMMFFRMNKMQQSYSRMQTNRDLILKMRQGGVTTYSCLYALDKALWEDGSHSAIMAHKRDSVKVFFRITKNAFNWFQKDWGQLYPVTSKTDNVNELAIKETGSELIVCTETKGLTLDFLHISEACFVGDDLISESLESVPLSGKVIMESTPDVAAGIYFDLWDQASKGEPCSFQACFFPWWFQYPEDEDIYTLRPVDPVNYSDKEALLAKVHELTPLHIAWRRIKVSECGGDEGEFMRKYPEDPSTCFLAGSSSVFSPETLMALSKQERKPAFYGDLLSK
jgi:hypothetical protein